MMAERIGHAHPTTSAAQDPAGTVFAALAPTTPWYGTTPILEGFTWRDCLASVREGRWYLVVFRSIRREDADEALLTAFDDRAYEEAVASTGLLHYFRGHLDASRACLSFCVWASQAAARAASRKPQHHAAARLVQSMYEHYDLERYHLVKHPGSDAVLLESVCPDAHMPHRPSPSLPGHLQPC